MRPHTAAIAHLGVGAFVRAHLGVYADDLLRRGVPAAIRGVSLHSTTAEERLEPQDGYYTVAEREPGSPPRLRVIGALCSVSTGVPAALDALTAPSTRVVSLTITEKGYDPQPDELEQSGRPSTAAGVLALALARRRHSGHIPPVVASLDNVSRNGDRLRARVHAIAAQLDPALPDWISAEVRFPNSVVDRMVPATTDHDLSDIAAQLGLVDLGAVTTEQHRSWITEADEALDIFGSVGAELVEDITPFEQRKLWLLNGPHSALAYGGLLAGHATIAAAASDPKVARFAQGIVEDVLAVAEVPAALQPRRFAEDALHRFANPTLRHPCVQVGADGSRKLPLRFGSVVSARRRGGLDTVKFAACAAIWVAALTGIEVAGQALPPLDDPEASRLAALPEARPPPDQPTRPGRPLRRDLSGGGGRNAGAAHTAGPPTSRGSLVRSVGGVHGILDAGTVRSFIRAQMDALDLDGRSLCLVVPDATRSCPLPLILSEIDGAVSSRVSSCTATVALGTHAPMTAEAMRVMTGNLSFPVVNHEWWDDGTYVNLGALGAEEVAELSDGLLEEAVEVRINRRVTESDVTLIIGPVLPHEVVGFSGGNKYLFPGLSGRELIDVTHWLGALITSNAIIGTLGITPVRALIDAAARLVPGERHALCVVVDHGTGQLAAAAFGTPEEAWASAAEVSATTHVEYLDAPVARVLSLVSTRYDDLWTGAKGFYKVEPVVADGGEVVLYAPHIDDIAAMHPGQEALGYHCRDYFLANWDRYRHYPRGELAHSTHLYGAGTYDPIRGERPRVPCDSGHRHPPGRRSAGQPGLSRSGLDRPRQMVLGLRDVGRARRGRGSLPTALVLLTRRERPARSAP